MTDKIQIQIRSPAGHRPKAFVNLESAAMKIDFVLKVPSILVPAAANFVLNPHHPAARKIRIGPAVKVSFDPRMWK